MIEETLELRGIPLSHLVTYLIECGGAPHGDAAVDRAGKALSDTLPLTIRGEGWEADVLREETVSITSRFHVQAVFIRFRAEEEERLAPVLKQFRVKVLRVGG